MSFFFSPLLADVEEKKREGEITRPPSKNRAQAVVRAAPSFVAFGKSWGRS